VKILIVDDDPDIHFLAEYILCKVNGHEVESVYSGQETIDVLRKSTPDLILMDYMLDDIEGPELIMILKKQFEQKLASTSIIFLTGKTNPEELAKILSTEPRGIIQKPFDPLKLMVEINSLL